VEIAPPFYRTGADRLSATPAAAADRAAMTTTVRHGLGLSLHRVPDLLKIEPNDSADLKGRDLSLPVRPIH
jgi:hypothetical protein